MELTEFLLARIAEDEWAAQQARAWATGSRDEGQPIDWRIHTRNWSPDRVLAECDAKRRIVEGIRDATNGGVTEYYIGPMMTTNDVLQLLALPYADHPNYQEAWAQ